MLYDIWVRIKDSIYFLLSTFVLDFLTFKLLLFSSRQNCFRLVCNTSTYCFPLRHSKLYPTNFVLNFDTLQNFLDVKKYEQTFSTFLIRRFFFYQIGCNNPRKETKGSYFRAMRHSVKIWSHNEIIVTHIFLVNIFLNLIWIVTFIAVCNYTVV